MSEYEGMKVGKLRKLVRDRGIAYGKKVRDARHITLVEALESGVWPKVTVKENVERMSKQLDVVGPEPVQDPDPARSLKEKLKESSSVGGAPSKAVLPTEGDGRDVKGVGKSELTGALAKVLEEHLKPNISREEVTEMVRAAVKERLKSCTTVEVKLPDRAPVNVGRQHRQFELLLKVISSGVGSAMMVGPAGSGKTRAAHEAAKALGWSFHPISVGPHTTESRLLGYMDANGAYVGSEYRRGYCNEVEPTAGALILLDEMDNGSAAALNVLNAGLANGVCSFPDGVKTRGENVFILAAANTYCTGANRQYVGRSQLDGALLDRLPILEWGYDEDFERDLGANEEWTAYVQKMRHAADELKVRQIISPRASIYGGLLLAAGVEAEDVEKMVLTKSIDSGTVEKLKNSAGVYRG